MKTLLIAIILLGTMVACSNKPYSEIKKYQHAKAR